MDQRGVMWDLSQKCLLDEEIRPFLKAVIYGSEQERLLIKILKEVLSETEPIAITDFTQLAEAIAKHHRANPYRPSDSGGNSSS